MEFKIMLYFVLTLWVTIQATEAERRTLKPGGVTIKGEVGLSWIDILLKRKPDKWQPVPIGRSDGFKPKIAPAPTGAKQASAEVFKLRDLSGRKHDGGEHHNTSSELHHEVVLETIRMVATDNYTEIANYPYAAALLVNDRLWCTGVIVDVSWVLTAAHCLSYFIPLAPIDPSYLEKFVKVRVGSIDALSGGTLVPVSTVVMHPKWQVEPTPHADAALLKLSHKLEFSSRVNLIKIYTGMRDPLAQSFVSISGWGGQGKQTLHNAEHRILKNTRLKVRTRQYCIDAYQLTSGFKFTQDFFCASYRNATRDMCMYDAGAPAVQYNNLVGIYSFGPEKCGMKYFPAIFTKSFYFRDFVKTTIASHKTTEELLMMMKEFQPHLEDVLKERNVHEDNSNDYLNEEKDIENQDQGEEFSA